MAQLRLSRAKYDYQCVNCARGIYKGQSYFRVEPFPMARMKGTEKVEHLCTVCFHGKEGYEEAHRGLRNYWAEQLGIPLPAEPITVVETTVHVANITADIIKALWSDPNEIYKLTPSAFEGLIGDRLEAMGFSVIQVGGHTYRKDGTIDFIAWSPKAEFPFLMAIQAKHHRSPKYKTGPGPVRELLGAVQSLPFNAGVLVTNTTFTPDAQWIAQQKPHLMQLRDIYDIRRWLENNFLDECDWRNFPDQIVVCPGVVITLPKGIIK
jgi:restriction endonuclease